MDEDLPVKTFIVTCETPDCDNSGIELTIKARDLQPDVQCGVCNGQITDITAKVAARK